MKKVIIGKIIATLLFIIIAVGMCMLICCHSFIGNIEKLSMCLMFSPFPAGGILITWACGM